MKGIEKSLYENVENHRNNYESFVETKSSENSFQFSVSIITACFNQSSILPFMLDSWSKQSYISQHPEKVQLILINDGSTDKTNQVISQNADKLPFHFIYINQPNHNEPFALNTGLMLAEGDIILFTNPDTLQIPSTLEAHIQMHKAMDSVLCAGFRMHIMPEELVNIPTFDINSLINYLPPVTCRDNKDGSFLFNYFNNKSEDRHSVLKESDDFKKYVGWQSFCGRNLPECVESHSLSIKRNIIKQIGGMEEDMLEWGVYDNYFGAKIIAYGQAVNNPIFIVPLAQSIGYHPWHGPRKYNGDFYKKIEASRSNMDLYKKRKNQPLFESLDPGFKRSALRRNFKLLEKRGNMMVIEQSL